MIDCTAVFHKDGGEFINTEKQGSCLSKLEQLFILLEKLAVIENTYPTPDFFSKKELSEGDYVVISREQLKSIHHFRDYCSAYLFSAIKATAIELSEATAKARGYKQEWEKTNE